MLRPWQMSHVLRQLVHNIELQVADANPASRQNAAQTLLHFLLGAEQHARSREAEPDQAGWPCRHSECLSLKRSVRKSGRPLRLVQITPPLRESSARSPRALVITTKPLE